MSSAEDENAIEEKTPLCPVSTFPEYQTPGSSPAIPNELLIHIFQFIDKSDWSILKCSLVNRSWNSAARDDLLWKAKTEQLFERYNGSSTSSSLYYIKIQLDALPSSNYKKSYVTIKQKVKKERIRLKKQQQYEEKKKKIQETLNNKRVLIASLISAFVFLFGCAFIAGLVVMDRVTVIPRFIYYILGIPLVLAFTGIFALLGIDMFIEKLRATDMGFIYFMAVTLVFFVGVLMTLILLLVNLALPFNSSVDKTLPVKNYYEYDRRIHIIPWHAVMAPLAVTCLILGTIATVAVITVTIVRKVKGNSYLYTRHKIDLNSFTVICMVIHVIWFIAILYFCIMFGFHMEFPKAVDISFSYILLWFAEIVLAVLFVVIWIDECKNRYTNHVDTILFLLVVLWNCSMIGSHILCCLYRFLHGYVYISFVVPLLLASVFSGFFASTNR